MKKFIVLISTLLISTIMSAYEWDSIGPTNVQVNNFNTVFYNISFEILCTSNGIVINEGGNWIEYTYGGLPAWSAVGLDPNNILVLLGDGSWSDGVYKFNLTSHQFEVVEYMAFPNFLQYCVLDSTYYAGGLYGLWKSADGINFTSIEYFDMKECKAIAFFENHFVVSADGKAYCSHDNGETWAQSLSGWYVSDMSFQNDGILYGILPGSTYSSGLWISHDFGETWDVEFWDMYMSSVMIDAADNIFVGWENHGVSQWNHEIQELTSFDDGLPDLHIHKITVHPEIDCINIVACTDSGAYLLTNYTVGIEEGKPVDQYFSLNNYPNPFDNKTTIVFSVEEACPITLSVCNMLGNMVAILFDGTAKANQEYKFEFSSVALAEGTYYYQLQSGNEINITNKMLCIK